MIWAFGLVRSLEFREVWHLGAIQDDSPTTTSSCYLYAL